MGVLGGNPVEFPSKPPFYKIIELEESDCGHKRIKEIRT